MFERNRNNKQGNPRKEEARIAPDSPLLSATAPAPARNSALIGPGIEISGDVNATADLVVNGKIVGSIVQGLNSVEIGESGQVMARIRAKLVKISGEVRGDITGDEKVLISKTGRVLGNISAPRVQLDDGAIFKGSIDMTPVETAKPAAPAVENKPVKPATPPPAAPVAKDTMAKSTGGTAPRADSERKEPSLTLKSG